MIPLTVEEISWAAQVACLLEVNAEKPGNVTRTKAFHDSSLDDFLLSAVAIGPTFYSADRMTVGETILRGVRDTRRLVNKNTNLGILFLLAPLTKAAASGDPQGLRSGVRKVLDTLTTEDARSAYEAIRISNPAGLGTVDLYDVRELTIDITLHQAMKLAENRDTLAREYVTNFAVTFELGYETIYHLWKEGHKFGETITQTFLAILAKVPDTLIARKNGFEIAREVSDRASEILNTGGVFSEQGRKELQIFDQALRDDRHLLNPGTTADLVAAALFVFLTQGGMLQRLPNLIQRW